MSEIYLSIVHEKMRVQSFEYNIFGNFAASVDAFAKLVPGSLATIVQISTTWWLICAQWICFTREYSMLLITQFNIIITYYDNKNNI